MRIFSPEQTAQALPYAQLVPALARAAVELCDGLIHAPERLVVPMGHGGVLLCMPAIAPDISVTKLVTVHPHNTQHGLATIQGEVVVMDSTTGARLALLDGPTVTARRTAAMSLLGIETLAACRPKTALLIGTGTQALAHAHALVEYFGTTTLYLAGTTLAKVEAFAALLRQRHDGLCVQAMDMAALQSDCPPTDVLIALTTAQVPVVPPQVAASTLVVGVGAFKPSMAEIPPSLLHTRPIVVDDLAGARHEAGDLLQAQVDWQQVLPLAHVLAGKVPHPAGIPVFKTVGQASWDLAAARVAWAASQLHG